MRLPQLQIQTTNAQLGIQKSSSHIQMQQPKAQVNLHQPQPSIQMRQTPGRLTIDQTEAWADMNLKGILRRNKEIAQEGYQAWAQYLAKKAQEGSELMKIENGGGAIAAQAKRNGQLPKHEFGIDFIPSPFSVRIDYQPGSVNVTHQTQDVVSAVTPQKPIIQYQPGDIKFNLMQQNSIQFDFTI
ncbi:DUF6470 family protein [Bacillus sp. AK031]